MRRGHAAHEILQLIGCARTTALILAAFGTIDNRIQESTPALRNNTGSHLARGHVWPGSCQRFQAHSQLRSCRGEGCGIVEPKPNFAQPAKYRDLLEKTVGMEVIQFREAQGERPTIADRQTQLRRNLCEHAVEVVAVDKHGAATSHAGWREAGAGPA